MAWFMYEFVALAIPMKHVHAPGKCNKAVSSKLHKHLRTKADEDDSEDEIFIEGEDAMPESDAEETPVSYTHLFEQKSEIVPETMRLQAVGAALCCDGVPFGMGLPCMNFSSFWMSL